VRRIYRRMGLLRKSTLGDYVAYLNEQPAEVNQLANDLLIGVTAFFRDPEMWDALAQQVLPDLVRRGDADQPVRVWVPGCSTGEEAYSLAIVASEAREAERKVFEAKAREEGKPDDIVPKIVEGQLQKWSKDTALLEQEHVRTDAYEGKTIEELRAEIASKTGENVRISRFARFVVGE